MLITGAPAIPHLVADAGAGGLLAGFPLMGWLFGSALIVAGAALGAWRRPERRRRALVVAALAILAFALGAWLSGRLRLRGMSGDRGMSAARLTEIDNSLRALEDGDRGTARDRWDPDYVVAMLGRDPQRLFQWVRDNTYWIPYRGELRGPVGVLQDRQGNSLDRALLLATLLTKAGQTVRLARGQLTAQQGRRLLPGLVARHAAVFSAAYGAAAAATPGGHPTAPEPGPNPGAIREAARQYHLDAATIEQTLAQQREAFAGMASELQARVRDQSERLLRAVPHADAGRDWAGRFRKAVAALQDHWWVQQRSGDGWVDLDALRGDDGAAVALPAIRDTLGLDDVAAAPVHHEIAVRVITEQWSAGTVSQRTTLEYVLRPSDVIGEPIVLQFWPVEWVSDTVQKVVGKDFRAELLSQRAWAASLFVGRDVVARAPILDTGDDPDAPSLRGGAMAGLGGALAQALGNAAGTPQDTIGHVLSAVWVEYEIRIPGEAPKRYRRTVFDLIGPAARAASSPTIALDDAKRLTRGYSLMMRTEVLPVVARLAPTFVTHLAARSLIGKRALLDAAVRGAVVLGTPAADSLLDHASPTLSPLYGLAVARLEWNPDAGLVYLDCPDLLTRHQYPSWSKDGPGYGDATDIVANEVGVSLAAPDAFRVRLAQGVLDTNAESLLQVMGAAPGNVGDAFRTPGSWVALTPSDAAALSRLDLPDDVRGRLHEDLAAGFDVVAPPGGLPAKPDRFEGWWRIDPATGDALGLGGNGWGLGPGGEESFLTNLRARLAAPAFWAMYRRFALAYATDYIFCIYLNTAWGGLRNPSWGGVKLGIVNGLEQCGGLGSVIVAGVFATAPLLFMYIRARYAEEALVDAAEASAAGRTGPKAPCPEGGGTVNPEAGSVGPPPTGAGAPAGGGGSPPGVPTSEDLADALKAYEDAEAASQQATKEYVDYRQNSPEYSDLPNDRPPQPYDPAVAEQLYQEAKAASNQEWTAGNRYDRLKNEYDTYWQDRMKKYYDAQDQACGASSGPAVSPAGGAPGAGGGGSQPAGGGALEPGVSPDAQSVGPPISPGAKSVAGAGGLNGSGSKL